MRAIFAAPLFLLASVACAQPATPAPEGARVYIISPANGAEVSSPVKVLMGLSGMGVAPAGVDRAGTGHHHLIIDATTPEAGIPIPSDARHRHFGGGQTEVDVELEAGDHTLQLVVGDMLHRPHVPPVVSDVIMIRVK